MTTKNRATTANTPVAKLAKHMGQPERLIRKMLEGLEVELNDKASVKYYAFENKICVNSGKHIFRIQLGGVKPVYHRLEDDWVKYGRKTHCVKVVASASEITFTTRTVKVVKCRTPDEEAVFTGNTARERHAILRRYPSRIQYIANPTLSEQLAAVQSDGNALQYINNPSLKVQLAAVRKNGLALRHINKPSHDVQLAAVQQNGYAIENIKKPSEAICLAAVRQNGRAIKRILNPSEAVCISAVQQNGSAILYISNKTEAVQLEAVRQYARAIQYISNATEAAQHLAVSLDQSVMGLIRNPIPVYAVQMEMAA